MTNKETVLLTGATGFVGRALYPMLEGTGRSVVCASRSVQSARRRWPDRRWVTMDVERPETVRMALRGCSAAYYLVHRMSDASDYEARESRAAINFAEAAAGEGLERIVYLGGVKPPAEPAPHLRSRLVTGSVLRGGEVPTVELRASMIIGHGSTSWKIVRDLARRLPVMLCPRWLNNRTEPLAIDDAVVALVEALNLELDASVWFDIPGPEAISFRECIDRAARVMGRHPRMVDVPVLTPRLSSYWLRLVTGADYQVAKALAENLRDDLLASGREYWKLIGHDELVDYDEAARRALLDEKTRIGRRMRRVAS